jgi:hypothetical protein
MTRDDIIKWAREAGASHDGPLFVPDAFALRFAALVAAAEREACAQIVEAEAMQYAEPVWAVEIINDIRARG